MLLNALIKLLRMKIVRIKRHREIRQGQILKSSMTSAGKCFLSNLTEFEKEIVQKEIETVIELYASSEHVKIN